MIIPIQLVTDGAIMPVRQHDTDAGWDLATPYDIIIHPWGSVIIDTGLRLGLPPGYEGQVRLRSSIGKTGVVIPNAPGTIDAGYRGTIKIMLHNMREYGRAFRRGERIAQLVIKEVPFVDLVEGEVSTETDRSEGGLGSTGR